MKDGGCAFPQPVAVGPAGDIYTPADSAEAGMSLRDWFAGAAVDGIADDCGMSAAEIAQRAYEIADAMLAERSKGDKT